MRRLVFFRPSPESRRNIKLPLGTLMRHGRLTIRTDLQDNHVYAMDRSVLAVLHAKPSLASIKQVEPHRDAKHPTSSAAGHASMLVTRFTSGCVHWRGTERISFAVACY